MSTDCDQEALVVRIRLLFVSVAVMTLGGCGGGSSYEVLAENPPPDSGEQEGMAGLQVEAEADSEAELLEVAREIADDYEEDGTDGLIMSFQEPGGKQTELGLGYVAYTESGRERLGPVAEFTGAPLDEEDVSVVFGSE